jgi:hypothetical protein
MSVKKQLRNVLGGFVNFPTLMSHLGVEDPLALVIRGHMYVEAALIKQIESALVNKNAFDIAKLNFPTKITIAVALGKVDIADARGFTALNTLRNKFAHDVQMTLTNQHELDLYNALSPSQREMIKAPRKAQTMVLHRLRFDVISLIANAANP